MLRSQQLLSQLLPTQTGSARVAALSTSQGGLSALCPSALCPPADIACCLKKDQAFPDGQKICLDQADISDSISGISSAYNSLSMHRAWLQAPQGF